MNRLPRPGAILLAISLMSVTWAVVADDDTAQSDALKTGAKVETEPEYKPKTKSALRRKLTPRQYDVTQNEGTEPAFKNRYWNNKRKGVYRCLVCERDLFSSDTKYKSGTGWPSFYAPIDKKNVGIRKDWKLLYFRTEVHCQRCNAHLGHVFDDGPKPTGKRYCLNSASLKFVEKSRIAPSKTQLSKPAPADSE